MFLLILFAFLAGIVTILSPCILPVLPIVLSGSLTGGRRRPLGIILGFILSFTFFTLALSSLVKAFHISPDVIRLFAIVVITLFGVTLLVPKLLVISERLFSKLTRFAPIPNQDAGFWGGILIGLSLGLFWTPCVGPILAGVISLALTGTVTTTTAFITLAYALGTAIPMLAIMYGGRNLMQRLPFLSAQGANIQRVFGIIMIMTAIAIFFNLDRQFQSFILQKFPNYGTGLTVLESNPTVIKQIGQLQDTGSVTVTTAPELVAGGEWFNSEPLTIASLKGKVVLIDFWTYTCINCIRTLPYIKSWDEKYRVKGLVIVGVHAPEFEFEKSAKNVSQAIKDYAIKYPVMQDNNFETWRAYDNHYWPAKFLIDKKGEIVYTHFGEGDYEETETKIQQLLSENGELIQMDTTKQDYTINASTPELYLGYARMEYLASQENIQRDTVASYSAPFGIFPANHFAFIGPWLISGERANAQSSALKLDFNAGEVFLVMRPKDGTTGGKVKVSLDAGSTDNASGEDVINNELIVKEDRLYKIIKLDTPGRHTLELKFEDNNIEIYAFTFG